MSGPETGGPPSGPKTDRLLSALDAAIGGVMATVAALSQLIRGEAMRANPGTNPHPEPKPGNPPPPRLRH
jgi:hypothetical protein